MAMKDPAQIYYVYMLVRPWNQSPCYVGKGKGDRWLAHGRFKERHPNKYLARIYAKAARLGVEVVAKKLQEGMTEEEALSYEIKMIKEIGRRANGGPLVNGNDGGDGGNHNLGIAFTKEHREKISAALKGHTVGEKSRMTASQVHSGKTISAEHRAAVSAAQKGNTHTLGRVFSAEERARMSEIRRGKPKSAEHRAKIGAAHRGRILHPEHVEKMAAAHRGKALSPEHKAKLSAATKGRPLAPEHREKIAAANRIRAALQRLGSEGREPLVLPHPSIRRINGNGDI